jgi:sulfonate transport system substrate-binding protein
MSRRLFLSAIAILALAAGASGGIRAAEEAKEIRIGYQKNGILVIARQQATVEKRLAARNATVKWVEFPSGPPLLEALNAGSVDFGQTGDAPPIFAQAAAGSNLVYVAGQSSTNGQGIVVKAESAIKSLADLKGKRIGFTKGSSAHNVILLALEKAGLSYGDITPVYLSPPDGASAFRSGSIDAWAVWDPYFAIGEKKNGGRVLASLADVGETNSFYIANKEFATKNPKLLSETIEELAKTASWAETHRDEVAKALAEVTGLDLDIQTIAANRSSFAIGKLTDEIIANQQRVADRFFKLGLIPKPIVIREAVWVPPQS